MDNIENIVPSECEYEEECEYESDEQNFNSDIELDDNKNIEVEFIPKKNMSYVLSKRNHALNDEELRYKREYRRNVNNKIKKNIGPNKNKINASYLAAYLKSPVVYHFFQSLNGGGAKAGLSLNTIQKIRVPVPNECQQNDIASIFSTIENFHTELREKKTKFLKMKKFISNVLWGAA